MTIEFDDTTQCYKIPVTGSVGSYRATVTKLFKKDGLLHVTVGYIPQPERNGQHPHHHLGYAGQVHGLSVQPPER